MSGSRELKGATSMLSPVLDDLANRAHQEHVRNALARAELLRVADGGPALRRARLTPRALLGARVMRAGAWIGGIDLEWSAERPLPGSRPAIAN
jgi:hypothetical protein